MMANITQIVSHLTKGLSIKRSCTMNVLFIIACSVIALLLLLYYATTRKFNYWKKKNIPYAKPLPFFGNYVEYLTLKKFTSLISQKLCRMFPNEPFFGTFFGTEPALMIQDPDTLKLVLTKDFYYFNSRELMDYTTREIVNQNLFFTCGDKWKVIRQNLTPLFSSAKMKNMFFLIQNCAYAFEEMLDYETGISKVVEAKAVMTRYTMDCICSCSFGIDVKTMEKNPENNTFLHMGRLIVSTSIIRGYLLIGRAMWPRTFYGLGFKAFPSRISKFFHNILTGVFESRGQEPSQRHDFVDLFLSLKKNNYIVGESMTNLKTGDSKKVELEVTDELLVSQCMAFFVAGFETSAGTLSLLVFELAKNQEAQRRAQQEVDEFLKRHNNELIFDCAAELPFLDACVSETLRLYPVLPLLTREVVEDYTFPSGLHLEKGTRVHIPVYHLHHNPDHFPDPEKFKPERFLSEAKHTIKPYTYFPFGEGPRICIGMRFAKMQVLSGLITFLKKFHVTLAEGTPETFQHQTTTIVLQPKDALNIKVAFRDGWEGRVLKR